MLILNVQYQNVIYLADCIFESLLKFCAQGKILPHFVLVAALPQSKLIISRLHFCNSFLTGLSTSIYSCQPSLIHSSHHCPTDLLKIQIDYITSLFQTIQLSQSTWNKIQIPCKTIYKLTHFYLCNLVIFNQDQNLLVLPHRGHLTMPVDIFDGHHRCVYVCVCWRLVG